MIIANKSNLYDNMSYLGSKNEKILKKSRPYVTILAFPAAMAELVDALSWGGSVLDVWIRISLAAPFKFSAC